MGGILTRNVLFWVVAAAAAVALWGCGGGDSSSTTAASNGSGATTTSKTEGSSSGKTGESSSGKTGGASQAKAEFVDQANAICKKGKKKGLKEMTAYAEAHANSSQRKLAQLAKALQVAFLPEVQNQVDEIRALGAPQGDEKQIEAFLDALEEGIEAASQSSASSGLQLGPNFKHSAQLARGYGLDACAYG
jgi:hypothetical protein